MTDHTPTDEHLRLARAEAALQGFQHGYVLAHRDGGTDSTIPGFPIERARLDAIAYAISYTRDVWQSQRLAWPLGEDDDRPAYPSLDEILTTADTIAEWVMR